MQVIIYPLPLPLLPPPAPDATVQHVLLPPHASHACPLLLQQTACGCHPPRTVAAVARVACVLALQTALPCGAHTCTKPLTFQPLSCIDDAAAATPTTRRIRAACLQPYVCHPWACVKSLAYDTRHTSHVTRHTSRVKRHASRVTRHTSHVTRHTSRVAGQTAVLVRHSCHVQGLR